MPTTKTVTLYQFEELDEEAQEAARRWWRESEDDKEFTELLEEEALYRYRVSVRSIYWQLHYSQGDFVSFDGPLDLDVLCVDDEHGRPEGEWPPPGLAAIRACIDRAGWLGSGVSVALHQSGRRGSGMDLEVIVPDWRLATAWQAMAEQVRAWYPRAGKARPLHARTTLQQLRRRDWKSAYQLLDWFIAEGHDVAFLRELLDLIGHPHSSAAVDEQAVEECREALERRLHESLAAYLDDAARGLMKVGYAELEYRQSDEVIDESMKANGYTFDEDGKRID